MALVLNLSDKPIQPLLEWLPPMVDATEPSPLYVDATEPSPLYPNVPPTDSVSTSTSTSPATSTATATATSTSTSGSPSENTLGVQQLVGLSMRVWVINWRQVDGRKFLEAISAGKMGLCMLPWFPMTIGGGDPDLMEEWKRLAQRQPDHNTRTEYGALALIFSEKGHCQNQWRPFMEGWNVEQSVIGNEWLKQGAATGALKQTRNLLTNILEAKFPGKTNAALNTRISGETNVDTLSHWLKLAATTNTFKKFVAAIEANGNPK